MVRVADFESVIATLQRQLHTSQDEYASLLHKHEELTLRTRRLTENLEEQSSAVQGFESAKESMRKMRAEMASSLAELQSANEQLAMLSSQLAHRDQVIVTLRNDLESIGTKGLLEYKVNLP